MLGPEEIDAISRGVWELDCPEMTLTDFSGSPVHRGPGWVRQIDKGQLAFKLFAAVVPREIVLKSGGAVGQLVPDSAYDELRAVDSVGRMWKAQRLLPGQYRTESETVILTGDIWRMQASSEACPSDRSTFDMWWFVDLDFPSNTVTHVQTSRSGRPVHESASRNAARFSACGVDFELVKTDRSVRLRGESNGGMRPNFETRAAEALLFVLGRSLPCTVLEKHEAGTRWVEVSSLPRTPLEPRLGAPIGFRDPRVADDVWRLFGLYLAHILPYKPAEGEGWLHPLSERIELLIEASCASVDVEGLVLGVAVEDVLRTEFKELGTPSPEMQTEIDRAMTLIADSDLRPELKKRIRSAVGNMKSARAEDRLRSLVDAGAIMLEQVESWRNLRNFFAHSHRFNERKDSQELLDLCGKVLVLFYHLIFWRIGYCGSYTDYGSEGYPTRQYRATSASSGGGDCSPRMDEAEATVTADESCEADDE